MGLHVHTFWQQDLRPTPLIVPNRPTVSQFPHCFANIGEIWAEPDLLAAGFVRYLPIIGPSDASALNWGRLMTR